MRKVQPFATGSEFESWKSINCQECYRYESESTEESKAGCPLAFHLDLASITGEIPFFVAERIGIDHDHGDYVHLNRDCEELAHEKEMVKPKYVNPDQMEMEL